QQDRGQPYPLYLRFPCRDHRSGSSPALLHHLQDLPGPAPLSELQTLRLYSDSSDYTLLYVPLRCSTGNRTIRTDARRPDGRTSPGTGDGSSELSGTCSHNPSAHQPGKSLRYLFSALFYFPVGNDCHNPLDHEKIRVRRNRMETEHPPLHRSITISNSINAPPGCILFSAELCHRDYQQLLHSTPSWLRCSCDRFCFAPADFSDTGNGRVASQGGRLSGYSVKLDNYISGPDTITPGIHPYRSGHHHLSCCTAADDSHPERPCKVYSSRSSAAPHRTPSPASGKRAGLCAQDRFPECRAGRIDSHYVQ